MYQKQAENIAKLLHKIELDCIAAISKGEGEALAQRILERLGSDGEKPERAKRVDEPAGFKRFMAAYPSGRKGDRARALKLWAGKLQRDDKSTNSLESIADEIVQAVEAYKAYWNTQDKKYILNADNYLYRNQWQNTVGSPKVERKYGIH